MSNESPVPATAQAENFYWIMSESKFIYAPTRTLFERPAVVRQIGGEAALLVEQDKVCSNLTWMPGFPTYIQNMVINEGELEHFEGNNLFNLYKPPKPISGDPDKADFWLEIGRDLWGNDLEHILDVLAFKVQHPEIKINHMLLLGSYEQGIGKDNWLAPLRRAVGVANWKNISAAHALKGIENNFTPFLRASILRVSEAHEMGPKRFAFYDSTKDWGAKPPETLTIADKHVKSHAILNAVLVIFTSNHKTDGLYIPPEDRRMFVAWSQCPKRPKEFWDDYYEKLKHGAVEHVAAYLAKRDVSKFGYGAEPPKTPAWQEIVAANTEPQNDDLRDLLEKIGAEPWDDFGRLPNAVTLGEITGHPECPDDIFALFMDKAKRRTVTHRLEAAGFVTVTCPDDKEGRWRINGRRQMIYARHSLSPAARVKAATRHVETLNVAAAALAHALKGRRAEQQAQEDFGE